jgi:hypothetical protein
MALINQIFHGSLSRTIDRFRIATHFGTRFQALSAIGVKYFVDNYSENLPTLYKVSLEIKDSHLVHIGRDWGMYGAWGALLPLREVKLKNVRNEEERKRVLHRFNSYHKKIQAISDDEVARVEAEKFVLEEMGDEISAFSYKNSVEGQGESYCLLDPSLATITDCITIEWPEVIDAFKTHLRYPTVADKVALFLSQLRK